MSRFETFKNPIPLNVLLIIGHITKAKVSSFALVGNISNCLCRETNNKAKVPFNMISYTIMAPFKYDESTINAPFERKERERY